MPSEASTQSSSGSEDECPSTFVDRVFKFKKKIGRPESGEYESSTFGSDSSNYKTASSTSSGSSGSSSSRSSSSEESSSSDSSSEPEESSESDAAEFENARNELVQKRLLHGMTSSPMARVPDEKPKDADSFWDVEIGILDISSIQDEHYADLDGSERECQQPSARSPVHTKESAH